MKLNRNDDKGLLSDPLARLRCHREASSGGMLFLALHSSFQLLVGLFLATYNTVALSEKNDQRRLELKGLVRSDSPTSFYPREKKKK